MRFLKFTLGGKTAFFKKPEVNTYCYFTYGNVHKVVLMGMFGAILGYNGYNNMAADKLDMPEFYEKLKQIKIAVIPMNEKGFTQKKIQQFNNSVGYASKEQGGNLIVKEQWLENPKWEILVQIDSPETELLSSAIMSKKCAYIPYLGKNDHPADIIDAQIIENCERLDECHKIDSLFLKDNVKFMDKNSSRVQNAYKYEENLPIALNETTQMYITDKFVQTNLLVESYDGEVYSVNGQNVIFF